MSRYNNGSFNHYGATIMKDRLTDTQAEKLGKELVNMLNLKKNKQDRYNTSWGDKTLIGLGHTIHRIVFEQQ